MSLLGLYRAPALLSALPASDSRVRSAKARILCGVLDELATRYARDASTRGLPTPGIYGRKYGDSSLAVDLDTYSGNRLRARLGLIGSQLYRHRLTFSVTILGRRIAQLRASPRRTSGSAIGGSRFSKTGWPTPVVQTRDRTVEGAKKHLRLGAARICIGDIVKAAWPTPMAGTPKQKGYNAAGSNDSHRRTLELLRGSKGGIKLSGSSAEMELPGLLNPEFHRWLMGYPRGWFSWEATETPSSRR